MKPFVLVATLRTPIALSRPLHLDGLLLAAAFRLDPSKLASLDGLIAVKDGIPQASAGLLIFDGMMATAQPVTRLRSIRLTTRDSHEIHATSEMPADNLQVNQMSPYRNRLTPHRPLAAIREVAWQALGDPEAVLALASTIDNVGTMHGQGFGEVVSWRVEDCAAEESDVGWRTQTRLLRRLPSATARTMFDPMPTTVMEDVAPVAPPYWLKDQVESVFEPTLASLIVSEDAAREAFAY